MGAAPQPPPPPPACSGLDLPLWLQAGVQSGMRAAGWDAIAIASRCRMRPGWLAGSLRRSLSAARARGQRAVRRVLTPATFQDC